MCKIILFRGGMCGDLLGKLLDSTIVDSQGNLLEDRIRLKKYWKLTPTDRKDYVDSYMHEDVVLLSHDTDLSYDYKDITVQVVCSDRSMMRFFSSRFDAIHLPRVINQVSSVIGSNEDFVSSYEKSLLDWQDYHASFNRFDISNLGTDCFLDDVRNFFNIEITERMALLYQLWQYEQREKFPEFFP